MSEKEPVKILTWEGCYDRQLKHYIHPNSFKHPAKFSLGLIERIYDYMIARGWLRVGDCVGDPFGGVGVGGIAAAYRGLHWRGVELEPKFAGMSQQNFNMHGWKYRQLKKPMPMIVRGDSREFAKHLGVVDATVTSPPYQDSTRGNEQCGIDWEKAKRRTSGGGEHQTPGASVSEEYGKTPGQIGALNGGSVDAVVSSPPFTQTPGGAQGINLEGYRERPDIPADRLGERTYQGRGGDRSAGNIELLSDRPGVDAVVSSPPYAAISTGAGGLNTKPAKKEGQQSGRSASSASQDTDQRYGDSDGQIARLPDKGVEGVVTSPPFRDARSDTEKSVPTKHGGPCAERHETTQAGAGYGEAPGQIDNLATGNVNGVVTSPPWEKNAEGSRKGSKFGSEEAILKCNRGHGASDEAVLAQAKRDGEKVYGESPGQIGQESKETYWQAMALVYAECFKVIKPGGWLAVVVKDYVKKGKVVPLCDDTVRLLEHLGFECVERVHAMLREEEVYADLFAEGGATIEVTERKSFFRRLAEQKGSPRIDWEEVIFCRKPTA